MKIRCKFNVIKKSDFMLRGKKVYAWKNLNILELRRIVKEYDVVEGDFKRNFIVNTVNPKGYDSDLIRQELEYLESIV